MFHLEKMLDYYGIFSDVIVDFKMIQKPTLEN